MAIKFSRLIISALGIFIPIFIIYQFLTYDYQSAWLPESWQASKAIQIMRDYITPVLFCIGWIYLMLLLATIMADSVDLMYEESSFISKHYLVFFGINTLVLFNIFLIPLITPITTIIAFSSMIFKGLTSRVPYDDLDKKTQNFVKRFTIIFVLPIGFLSVLIIPESLTISLNIFDQFWNKYVEELFYFIKALGVALSIGAAVMLYQKGANEAAGVHEDVHPSAGLVLFELIMVVLIVYLSYEQVDFVENLYLLSPIFSGIAFVINLFKGRKDKAGDYGNPFGIAVWLAFMITIVLFRKEEFLFLRIWLIILSTILFTAYYIAFLNHPAHDEK